MDFAFSLWVVLGPVLASLVGGGISFLAKRNNWISTYRVLGISSFLVILIAVIVMFSVLLGDSSDDPQAGLVVVFLPFWSPILLVALLIPVAAGYAIFRQDIEIIKESWFKNTEMLTLKVLLVGWILYSLTWLLFFIMPK